MNTATDYDTVGPITAPPSACAKWYGRNELSWDAVADRVLTAAAELCDDDLADALDEIRLNLQALARRDRATDSAQDFYRSATRACIAMVEEFDPDDDVNRAKWAGRAAAYSDAARVLALD